MPDIQLIGLILLLAVAVMFGYFYFKRAQSRDVVSSADVGRSTAPPVQPTTPVAPQTTTTTTETVRRDGVDDI